MMHARLMTLRLTVLLGLVGGATMSAAQTAPKDAMQDLPGWKIPEICAKDSAPNHCLTQESRAWRAVSGSWISVPDAVRKSCVGGARPPQDQSWRVLNDCVDEAMEKANDKRAVATRRTPSEAVPPAKVVVAVAPVVEPVVPPVPTVVAAPAPVAPAPVAAAVAPAPVVAAPVVPAAPVSVAVPPPVLGMPIGPPPFASDAEARAKAAADAAAAKQAADTAAAATAEAARKAATVAAAKVCQDKLQAIAAGGVILFQFARAELESQSLPTLNRLADSLKDCPGTIVRIEGHTDAIGSPESNMDLSLRRAQAVVTHLVKAGLDASRIKAEGFGMTKPIADNATFDGRAKNRRIGFAVAPQ